MTTTARSIIEGALSFGLNRLSPGETLDADTANTCLTALNMICDEFNGSGGFLFRDLMTQSTAISAASAGVGRQQLDWPWGAVRLEVL